MANASIRDLGNNQGLLYITEIDGTTFINGGMVNNADSVDIIKRDALNRAPVGTKTAPQGTFTVDSITVNGTITSLTIDLVEQFDTGTPITLTSGAEETAAADIAAAVNAHVPVSGERYRATVNGTTVYFSTVNNVGSLVNGDSINEVHTGTAAFTDTDIDGGQNGNEAYSEINGRRYWLDANFGPTGCSGSGTALINNLTNAIEITDAVVKRGNEGGIPVNKNVIDSNLRIADYVRLENVQVIFMAPGISTPLEFIPTNTATLGDTLIMYGIGNVVAFTDLTVATGGNIKMTNQVAYESDTVEKAISFRFVNDATEGLVWAEQWRSVPFIAPGSVGTTQLATTSVTSAILALLSVGTAQLAATSVTTAKMALLAVDSTILAATSVTTPKMALLAVDSTILADNAVTPAKLAANSVETAKILNANVTLEKLESDLAKGFFVVPISFDAGRLGIFEVKVPFDLTVTEVLGSVTFLIENTDDKTFIGKNNAGTAWTGGQIDFTGGAVFGNSFTSSPTGNNNYLAGQVIKLETLATTPGGNVTLTICYNRD